MVTGFDLAQYSSREDWHDTELLQQAPDQGPVAETSRETQTHQFAALQHEQQKTETLLRIFTELSTSLDLQHVLHATLKVLGEYVGADHISIWVSQNGKSELQALAQINYPPDSPQATFLCQNGLDQELAAAVLEQAQPMLIEDILQEPVWQRQISAWQPSQLYRSVL